MDRKEFLAAAGVGAAALVMGCGFRRRPSPLRTPAAGAPNLALVLTDDQMPHTVYRMPKTLSAFRYDLSPHAYVNDPACGQNRNSLLTGQLVHNHGVISSATAYSEYRRRGYPATDLLSRLRAAGYRVGFFGKFMNDYGDADGETWVHPACRDGGRWVVLAGGNHRDTYWINTDGTARERREDQTALFWRYAKAWAAEVAGHGPFALFINDPNPHGPHDPQASYEHSHDGERWTSPGTEETDTSDKSAYWRGPAGAYESAATQQRFYEGQLEELEAVDVEVAATFGAGGVLASAGVLDETLRFFATDNGHMAGEHGGMLDKGLPYEESVHTPFLVDGPGHLVPAGRDLSGRLVSTVDITATMLDAAGADTQGLDGRSLLPLFADPGEATPWRRRVLIEHPIGGWYKLRDGPHSYSETSNGERELYRLDSDPHELENLMHEPTAEAEAKSADLSGRLDALKSAAGDALRGAEGG